MSHALASVGEILESGFTPLYPFWKKNDMGGIGAALPEPLGASSPASPALRLQTSGPNRVLEQVVFWNSRLAHPTRLPRLPTGSLSAPLLDLPSAAESPWRGGGRKEMGRGPCHHPEFLRPWHKDLGSRPPSMEEGPSGSLAAE